MTDNSDHYISPQYENRVIIAFTAVLWIVWFGVQTLTIPGWNGIATLVPGIPAFLLLWQCARAMRRWPFLTIIAIGPFLSLLVEFIHLETSSLVFHNSFSWQVESFRLPMYLFTTYIWSLFYFTWYLGYFTTINYYRFMRETLAASEVKSQTNKAQLQMLRYQLNPHFLFNTLNSISALVLDNKNSKAETTIGNLSRFLRFSLDKKPGAKIPLQEEIDVTKEYLEIEKMRFSEKLNIHYKIDPLSLSHLVPSLILQPVIENAIKHAIAPKKTGGIITIKSQVKGDRLFLTIEDNGPGLVDIETTAKKALHGTRERLKGLYKDRGNLSIVSKTDMGTVVEISFPVELSQ